jgi:hypothetical protein
MLITFHCETHADITMFGDIARQLIRLTGHSVGVPGAILAEDVPEALAHLKRELEQPPEPADAPSRESGDDDDDKAPVIGLGMRAFPLLEMLAAAARDHKDVMWDSR